MASLTFTIKDTATPAVDRLKALASGPGAKRAAGIGLRQLVRSHLRELPPNKRFPEASTGFWPASAKSVTAPKVAGDEVTISITQLGVRQRYFGGDIDPVNFKFLTIAATAIAYGRRAGEFQGLKFAFAQDVNGELHPALVAQDAGAFLTGTKRRKGSPRRPPIGPGDVVYWLYRHVHQNPNPDVLPSDAEMPCSIPSKAMLARSSPSAHSSIT